MKKHPIMNDNNFPLRLNKCPIADALVEIRFRSNLDRNVVFGMIYNQVKDKYKGNIQPLPILQIPSQVRDSDPELQFKPLYRIEGDGVILQIGPDVICFSSTIPYIGWKRLSFEVKDIIRKLSDNDIISEVTRLGHRYVNFFEGNVQDDLNMRFNIDCDCEKTFLHVRTDLKDGNFVNIVQFTSSANLHDAKANISTKGQVIDIDTSRIYENEGDCFLKRIDSEIDAAHLCEKRIFFSLLNNKLINSLEPIYNE